MSGPVNEHVLWHDIECGSYDADLALWRELAAEVDGPVLDVGAGTGRVTLHLAARGVEVTALDLDEQLLDALGQRAAQAGLSVERICADACDLSAVAGRGFAAVIVPMQTLQLLDDAAARSRFYAGARAALRDGGLLVCALAEALDAYDATPGSAEGLEAPLPDMREVDGVVYASCPIAIHDAVDGVVIERDRQVISADGERRAAQDLIRLARVTAASVTAEALPHGFVAQPARVVPPTLDYVGSEVVVLRGV